MLISQMINQLQKIQAEHGDLFCKGKKLYYGVYIYPDIDCIRHTSLDWIEPDDYEQDLASFVLIEF